MKLIFLVVCLVGVVSSLRPPLRQTPDFCLEEAVRGPCRARYLRYYYNEKSEKCEAFTYGGCGGNLNNFWTINACRRSCIPK
ncbi:hypothetical protein Y032_0788g2360 [Ancylostoma ceylanicum]|uniref:BPTI/Kunitz inhibitor domain-containing protein n=1 Tax=Ancylostoma ceylanicum TaxID=53326 RepID=A0A016WCW6_9BILA|nr:hypothetical protein Y032_0788g2360 [Ancylostoma ceylanicum]